MNDVLQYAGPHAITFIPAHPDNVLVGNPDEEREGVVCHIMEGSFKGCISWFQTFPHIVNGRDVGPASTNFLVSKSGEICQMVRLGTEAPCANGVLKDLEHLQAMDAGVKAMWASRGYRNFNNLTWSIEHEGRAGEQITDFPLMFDASTWLSATLLNLLPESKRKNTWGHYQFDGLGRPNCPKWNSQTWRLYDGTVADLVARHLDPPAPTPAPEFPLPELRGQLDITWATAMTLVENLQAVYGKTREKYPDF